MGLTVVVLVWFLCMVMVAGIILLTIYTGFNFGVQPPFVDLDTYMNDHVAARSHEHADTSHIPRRIVQTYKSKHIPQRMADAVCSIMNNHPTFEYEFFDDDGCLEFMKDHYSDTVCDAYTSLIPGAYKADIFRLCYLLKKGGWYIDITMCANPGLESVEWLTKRYPECKLFIVADVGDDMPHRVYQAFIGTVPNSPYIQAALDEVVKRVTDRSYCQKPILMTGPGPFGMGVNRALGRHAYANIKHVASPDVKVLEMVPSTVDHCIKDSDATFVRTKYTGWRQDRVATKSKHYSDLFAERNVYLRAIDSDPIPSVSSDTTSIPHLLWQTWETRHVTENMHWAMQTWRRSCPDWQYMCVDNQERAKMIRDILGQESEALYKSLRPGAFRADYWRLVVLWAYGGVYTDADTMCFAPLEQLLPMDAAKKTFVVAEDGLRNLANGFMAASPAHPLLKKAIDMLEANVRQQIYPDHDVDLTGPGLLGCAARALYKTTKDFKPGMSLDSEDSTCIIIQHDGPARRLRMKGHDLIVTKYDGYDEERHMMGGNDWAAMFREQIVYR